VLQASEGTFPETAGLDINTRGAGVDSEGELRKGEVVRLLLPPQGVRTVVPVLAEVVWCEPAGKRHRAGLRFLI
jgi:hypothetical protein